MQIQTERAFCCKGKSKRLVIKKLTGQNRLSVTPSNRNSDVGTNIHNDNEAEIGPSDSSSSAGPMEPRVRILERGDETLCK